MKDLLCDISAFRYWRLPPQVRALCPPLPRPEEDRQRYDLARNPTAAVALGFPLYTLVRTRNKRTCPASIRQRLFLGELPRESVLETEHGFLITSPLLTAFIMSRHLTDLQLLLCWQRCAACLRCVPCQRHLRRSFRVQLIRARFRQRSVGCAARPRTAPPQIYGVETLWFWAETLTVFVQMFAGCVAAIDLWRYRNSFHWVPRRLLRSRRICCLDCREPWEAKVFAA